MLATTVGQAPEGENPAVIYQPYGAGRVVVIEGAGMWRWAFLPPQQQQHEQIYQSLWQSLFRWLASSSDLLPGQQLALRSDKVRFGTTEPATATLLMREEAGKTKVPTVELRGDTLAKPQMVVPTPLGDEPGAFRVAFGTLAEGHYQARIPDTTANMIFDVRNNFEEQLDLEARPDLKIGRAHV